MRHLIIGAGPAGIAAIETIRSIDPGAEIGLVCDEAPCARMVLPYYLAGNIPEAAVLTADDAWLREQRVDVQIGKRVRAIDPRARRVALEGGGAEGYDRLLVATGSRTARPPLPGADDGGVHDMWTLADARGFLAGPRREVVVVGAGFIGLVILDALVARGARVSYVELAPAILPRMLDVSSAALVAAHLRERGIEVHSGESVQRIERAGDRRRLALASGASLDCDAVILATGIRANLELLEGSGIASEHGILADAALRTSAPEVFAAGDVCQGPNLHASERSVQAIQPTAVDHGRVAGANMAGLAVRYEGSLTMNVLHTLGLQSASFGLWGGAGDATVVENSRDRIYRKYVWDGDRMVGAVLVGPNTAVSGANDTGMLKGLIQTGVPLGPWKAYLQHNPLDLRRAFVASGAAKALLGETLLAGRASAPGGFRFGRTPARRPRSPHHAVLLGGRPV